MVDPSKVILLSMIWFSMVALFHLDKAHVEVMSGVDEDRVSVLTTCVTSMTTVVTTPKKQDAVSLLVD